MILAKNPKAKYDYNILETYQAGVVLSGQEVKSIKNKRLSLKGSFVRIKDGEVWLINASIPPYQVKNTPADYDPTRERKLLLRREEINRLIGKSKEKGLTLVPLQAYTQRGKIKIEFGLGKGKRKTDKRETIKKRESQRKIEQAIRRKF